MRFKSNTLLGFGRWRGKEIEEESNIYCKTGFSRENSDKQSSLSLEFTIEIMPIIPYVGVVFSFT